MNARVCMLGSDYQYSGTPDPRQMLGQMTPEEYEASSDFVGPPSPDTVVSSDSSTWTDIGKGLVDITKYGWDIFKPSTPVASTGYQEMSFFERNKDVLITGGIAVGLLATVIIITKRRKK